MITALLSLGTLAPVAVSGASPEASAAESVALTSPREFKLDWSDSMEPPAEPAPPADAIKLPAEPADVSSTPGFGSAGSHWLTFGGAAAYDFNEDYDFNLHFAWSMFLADRFEFGIEGAAWYFDQVGDNTAGISGMFEFRYHWWAGPNGDFEWTSFVDLGTGLLAALDEVPDGGSGFDFIQRAGLGITKDLDASDGPAHGARLVFGVRWHHISNGRFSGDERNPARDAILGFVGVTWDF